MISVGCLCEFCNFGNKAVLAKPEVEPEVEPEVSFEYILFYK